MNNNINKIVWNPLVLRLLLRESGKHLPLCDAVLTQKQAGEGGIFFQMLHINL